MARPLKNAFGEFDAAPLVLIDVATDQGITGRSYSSPIAKMTLKPLVDLVQEIGRDLVGKPIAPCDLMAAMDAKFRLLGWQGLVGMAVSGLDMAFWDVARPGCGQARGRIARRIAAACPAYDSYGVVDPIADENDLRRSLEQGFRGIKIKGGDGDAANDELRSKACAAARPRHRADARFQPVARSCRSHAALRGSRPIDLHWIEEPVPQENLLAMPRCARPRRSRSSPARTGGFRAALPKRSRPAPATSSCPT